MLWLGLYWPRTMEAVWKTPPPPPAAPHPAPANLSGAIPPPRISLFIILGIRHKDHVFEIPWLYYNSRSRYFCLFKWGKLEGGLGDSLFSPCTWNMCFPGMEAAVDLHWYIYFLIYLFLLFILFLAALGLRCCARAFSSCGEWGLLFVAVRGLLILVASLVEHGL